MLEGECTIRTPHKEFVLKQFDTVLLQSGESYQLCNTGTGRMLLLGAGNSGVDGKPRTRVPKIPSHNRSKIRLLRDGAKIYALTR